MSRRIEHLEPGTQTKCRLFLAECAERGFKVLVVQTYRTAKEQDALFAQGRSKPGKIVTYAPSGYSWHEFGRAFDICFLDSKGNAKWDGPWDEVGEIGEACGLEWGGRWKKPDKPHFEDRGGLTLAEARRIGYVPKEVA